MNSITTYEQLGELYIETLAQNAYYQGAAGTIASAVFESLIGDSREAHNTGCLAAASKLTRDAMGFMERTLSWISDDWFKGGADWARIDQSWDQALNATEQRWLHEQLSEQADRAWRAYFDHSGRPDPSKLGLRWHHDMALAASFLQAAAMLVADAFGIETEVAA